MKAQLTIFDEQNEKSYRAYYNWFYRVQLREARESRKVVSSPDVMIMINNITAENDILGD